MHTTTKTLDTSCNPGWHAIAGVASVTRLTGGYAIVGVASSPQAAGIAADTTKAITTDQGSDHALCKLHCHYIQYHC